MKNNIAISVVMPAYNSEKYIRQCFDSIIDQTFTNFEVVVVNDGSTDGTKNIINEYCDKDNRFKIISQVNSGPSTARNVGVRNANGKYVIFLDSDDFFESSMFQTIKDVLDKTNADMFIFDYDLYQDQTGKIIKNPGFYNSDTLPDKTFSYKDMPDFIFTNFNSMSSNKALRRSFITENNLLFPDNLHRNEDFVFMNKALVLAKSIFYKPDVLLHYRVGLMSNSSSTIYKYPNDYYLSAKDVKTFLVSKKVYSVVEKSFKNMLVEHFYHAVINLLPSDIQEEVFNKLKQKILVEFGIDNLKKEDFYNETFYSFIKVVLEKNYTYFLQKELLKSKEYSDSLYVKLEATETRRVNEKEYYESELRNLREAVNFYKNKSLKSIIPKHIKSLYKKARNKLNRY